MSASNPSPAFRRHAFFLALAIMAGALLLAATALAGPAAATFFVAPDGNDGNPGSSAAPWQTLQHAVDTAAPGDTIEVRAGTYAGARIERSGTAQAWLTLRAATGQVVIIDRPGPDNRHGSNLELETWEGDGVVAYWVIEGLEVTGAPSWGIDSRGNETQHSHHLIIRNNHVHHNGVASGRTGIFAAFTDDIIVEYNDTHDNGEHGVYLNNSSDRFTVRYNRSHANQFAGLHFNGDESMGGDGIMSNGLIEGNLLYDNGNGGAAINLDGIEETVIRNNVITNNRATGIAIFQQDGAICSRNNTVIHNTIQMPDNGRWAILISGTGCTGNQIFNNIILSDHAFRGAISLPATSVSGIASDYNIVANRFSTDDGDSNQTLAAWQQRGYDTHSVVASAGALFVDPGSDFHLLAGAVAVDMATGAHTTVLDADRRNRPAGAAPDVGAYEFSAESGTPVTPTATATATPTATPTATGTIPPPLTPLPIEGYLPTIIR